MVSEAYCFGAEGIELLRRTIANKNFTVVRPPTSICLERVSVRCAVIYDGGKGDRDDAD